MPGISRFLGVVVTMYFNDHEPPHFHARYGEYRVLVGIEDLHVLDGHLPPRVAGLVIEWAGIHRAALSRNWILIREEGKVERIEPLA